MRYDTPVLPTKRLLLRPIVLADSAAVQAQYPRWDIVKYLSAGMPWPYPQDGAFRLLRDITLPSVSRGEEWAWAITLRSDPTGLIGMISLMTKINDNRGYWLGSDWQGRGLMSEACGAATDYWFDVLGFAILRESKAMANAASRRISQREGMRLVAIEEQDFVAGRLLAGIWEISVGEWRKRRSDTSRSDP